MAGSTDSATWCACNRLEPQVGAHVFHPEKGCPVLPIQPMGAHFATVPEPSEGQPGLERRYVVYRRRGFVDGQEVLEEVQDRCFVLRPDNDIAARVALRAYAEHTSTPPELRADIHAWVDGVIETKPLVR